MVINQSFKKALKQVDLKRCNSVHFNGSGGGSSDRSTLICHKCVKKGHIQRNFRSKVNSSSEDPSKKSINELLKWFTKKPVVSGTKYPEITTTTCNSNKYKWYSSFNNGNCAWLFFCVDG